MEVFIMKKVLVTCFDPFGGATVNPSQMAVTELPNEISGVKILKQVIPTVFNKSIDMLYEILKAESPDAVICVGQAGGRPNITVERIAINIDDSRIPDNDGEQPIDIPIFADGPSAYFATLPIKAMVKNCNDIGIPAAISNTAGTFVCNHLIYAACHYAASNQPGLKAGFVHIPFVPEQTTDKQAMPSMSCTDITTGLVSFIKTVVRVDQDVKVAGGASH